MPPPPGEIESSAKVLVLSCIDPRYSARLEKHLIEDKHLHGDYDAFSLAGAELGAIMKIKWRKTLFEHIELAIDLHGINCIYAYSHLDCGAYKHFHNMTHDDDAKIHTKELRKLKKMLKKKFPHLDFRGYVMFLDGMIKLMVK